MSQSDMLIRSISQVATLDNVQDSLGDITEIVELGEVQLIGLCLGQMLLLKVDGGTMVVTRVSQP